MRKHNLQEWQDLQEWQEMQNSLGPWINGTADAPPHRQMMVVGDVWHLRFLTAACCGCCLQRLYNRLKSPEPPHEGEQVSCENCMFCDRTWTYRNKAWDFENLNNKPKQPERKFSRSRMSKPKPDRMDAREYREIIEKLGMTQVGAAHFLGIHPRTSRKWIAGKATPTVAAGKLLRLMLQHGITAD
jgi:DNA-binding transcriptional regulator YiaG